jgi:hypothetical protein
MHDPARPPQGHTSEPVGYNLGDSRYEQPPVPLLLPYGGHAVARLSTGLSTTGFMLSISGLATAMLMPVVTLPLVIAGIAISATALGRCRRGLAAGRGLAIAGLVLGIIGVILNVLMILFFADVFNTTGP